MFHLIATKPDGFTADDLSELCRKSNFPPDVIKRLSGKLFREFQAAGYIQKTDRYKLSARNSSPQPLWKAPSKD